jgi:phage-related protein
MARRVQDFSRHPHFNQDTAVPNLVHSREIKRLSVAFYMNGAGSEPVKEWLKSKVSRDDRTKIGTDIKAVELGWPLGMPLCRPLGRGLWEVRTDLQDRIARVIFFIYDGQMVLLHGFIKKDQQTPKSDIGLALKRKREVENIR